MTLTYLSAIVAKMASNIDRLTTSVSKTEKRLGSIGQNQGDITEEYFYNSLRIKPLLGGIQFDRVTPNLIVGKKGKQSEFDLVMTNGACVALIEVKQKAHINDLTQVELQIKKYRELCPEYKDFKLYGGIAGFSVPPDVVKAAHERGLFVLKRSGGVLTVDADSMQAF
jgi:hypothetical protein